MNTRRLTAAAILTATLLTGCAPAPAAPQTPQTTLRDRAANMPPAFAEMTRQDGWRQRVLIHWDGCISRDPAAILCPVRITTWLPSQQGPYLTTDSVVFTDTPLGLRASDGDRDTYPVLDTATWPTNPS